MDNNYIKLPIGLKFYFFIFNNFYLLYLFSNNKYRLKKISRNCIRLVKYYNYLFIFSFNISILKLIYFKISKLFYYFNYNFNRNLIFIGKGSKFIINSINSLFINNEFSHTIFTSIKYLNFKLVKYDNISLYFSNFNFMFFFISFLEYIKKKDVYKGKGIYDKTKKIILKLGKKSDYR